MLTRWQSLNIVAEQGVSTNYLPRKAFQKLCFKDKEHFNCIRQLSLFKLLMEANSGKCQMYSPYTDEQTSCCLTLQLSSLCLYKTSLQEWQNSKDIPASSSKLHTGLHFTSYNCIISYDCSLSWHHTEHLTSIPLLCTVPCFAVLCRWMSEINHVLVCLQLKESVLLLAGSPTMSIVFFSTSTQRLLTEMLCYYVHLLIPNIHFKGKFKSL